MKTPIMQFGTSRFLQAHADLFISEAAARGEALGGITVVQTSGSPERASRLTGLTAAEGFPVQIRGLENGVAIDRTVRVSSVKRALSTATDWDEIARIFINETAVVLCNTADKGYDISAEPDMPNDAPPASSPGKLTKLLHARYTAGQAGLTVLPCELISANGDVLRSIILDLAGRWYPDVGFMRWLSAENVFCNTLVDRIVSEALQPAGAVAEPYALWAIQRKAGQVLPCSHAAIVVADDIDRYEKLKLFILNLGHTVLADLWLKRGSPADMTVKDFLAIPEVRTHLLGIYDEEVMPGFAGMRLGDEAKAYVTATLQRFENPFLAHFLRDIAQNHAEKIERRLGGFINWSGTTPPRLVAIAGERR